MQETQETGDLLSLIGQSMDDLRRSIDLFEASERAAGLAHLAAVVQGIDAYLQRLDPDPLLRLAPVSPEKIRSALAGIRQDLDRVIDELSETR